MHIYIYVCISDCPPGIDEQRVSQSPFYSNGVTKLHLSWYEGNYAYAQMKRLKHDTEIQIEVTHNMCSINLSLSSTAFNSTSSSSLHGQRRKQSKTRLRCRDPCLLEGTAMKLHTPDGIS